MVTTPQSSVSDRVEFRRQIRNLENFLNYDFSEHKKLCLMEDKVHDHVIEVLKEIDKRHLAWKEYPKLWWYDGLNLKKISEYIVNAIPTWEKLLQGNDKHLVLLERQCALFERLTAAHDKSQVASESEPPEKPIAFVNPFKKVLRVVSNYPLLLGQSLKTKSTQEVYYDRLTSAAELRILVEEAKNKPLSMQILGLDFLEKGAKVVIPFTVVPKKLFKTVSQDKKELFDPTDDQLREKVQTINITYDDPDSSVLYYTLFKAGEKQALSHVYEQGFIAGKITGYAEAMQKIQDLFSGKSSK